MSVIADDMGHTVPRFSSDAKSRFCYLLLPGGFIKKSSERKNQPASFFSESFHSSCSTCSSALQHNNELHEKAFRNHLHLKWWPKAITQENWFSSHFLTCKLIDYEMKLSVKLTQSAFGLQNSTWPKKFLCKVLEIFASLLVVKRTFEWMNKTIESFTSVTPKS